jgi:hypothetical protein
VVSEPVARKKSKNVITEPVTRKKAKCALLEPVAKKAKDAISERIARKKMKDKNGASCNKENKRKKIGVVVLEPLPKTKKKQGDVVLDPSLQQRKFMGGVRFLEKLTKEQYDPYNGASEIDSDAQNPDLMLTTDHECQDPFERLAWGGMIVYLNAILKLFGITPKTNLYFDKSRISPLKKKLGQYVGNPSKHTMGYITVDRLSNLMKEHSIDVSVVHVVSIFKSTQHQR